MAITPNSDKDKETQNPIPLPFIIIGLIITIIPLIIIVYHHFINISNLLSLISIFALAMSFTSFWLGVLVENKVKYLREPEERRQVRMFNVEGLGNIPGEIVDKIVDKTAEATPGRALIIASIFFITLAALVTFFAENPSILKDNDGASVSAPEGDS